MNSAFLLLSVSGVGVLLFISAAVFIISRRYRNTKGLALVKNSRLCHFMLLRVVAISVLLFYVSLSVIKGDIPEE